MGVMVGKSKVMKNLNDALSKINNKTRKSLVQVGILVKGRSQALTPVDTGNLKAGHYTSIGGSKNNPIVEIGLTAPYALYVHEDLNANHPTGQAKFLEQALEASEREIITIIKNGAKI